MPDYSELQSLIGRTAVYEGRVFTVMELLREGPSLVLVEQAADRVIQSDQFGKARRRVPKTWTIPALSRDGSDFSPLVREMGLAE